MSGKILYGGKSNTKVDQRGLGAFFFYNAEKHADKICQINGDTGESETFSSVKTRTTRVAIEMRKRGIKENDVLLFCSKNNLDNAIPIIAALYLGAKVASTDPTLSMRDTTHAINLIRPKFIFVEEDCLRLMEESLEGTTVKATIVVLGQSKKYAMFEEFQLETPEEESFVPFIVKDCRDTGFIFFSSGTTGLPKGICCPHSALMHTAENYYKMNHSKLDALFHYTSLYWISAAMFLTLSFMYGGYRVLASDVGPEKLFKFIEKYKITFIFMAPIKSYGLTSLPNAEQYDTSSLNSIWLSGTPLSIDQLERTRQLLKHTHVTNGYGQTEASAFICMFDLIRDANLYKNKGNSAGRVCLDIELKVVDAETREILPANQQGEICFRAPFQMNGYYNCDSSDAFDEDGFIKTGDVGYYDEDECLFIIDRIKEMFKYQSKHVVPTVLEAVLLEHPAVKEAVVFGLPHEIDGFHPAACVILKPGAEVTVEELDEFVTGKVADYQKLRGGIKFVGELLKTPSGKVQRNRMREMFIQSSL